jgi:Xaa-Pro dipeptidase
MIEERLARLRAEMARNEVDAFISLKLVNTYYLSGFTSLDTVRPTSYTRPIAVVVDASGECLIVPLLDEEAAGNFSEIRDIRCYTSSPAADAARALVGERLREIGTRSVAIEEDVANAEWIDFLRAELPNGKIVHGRRWIEALRMRKDEAEIETLRRAGQLADAAITASLGASASGKAEISAETVGVVAMREAASASGGEASIVDAIPMVLCGARSSMPHEFTTSREMEQGELMWHCWLVSYRGYWAENIRTGIVEDSSARFAGPFSALRESLLAGQEAATPGARACDVFDAVMGVLKSRPDDGGDVLNRSGHGMGLEYHEPPFIENSDQTVLEDGMIITVEPGIWIPGTGGLALSNTIVVRESGAELITRTPIDLFEAWGGRANSAASTTTGS